MNEAVIDLMHSVDPAYRVGPRVGFMMHDTIAASARKLKDSNGQYMWQMSLQAGQPDRLFGYPVYINNDMASTLATGKQDHALRRLQRLCGAGRWTADLRPRG